jgi:hypothetical protein
MPLSNAISRTRWSLLLKLALLIILVVAGHYIAGGIADVLEFEIRPSNESLVHQALMVAAVVYALLIAVPFVPGVEVGLAILAVFGPPIVLLVYLSTLLGLTISFTIGRLIPTSTLIGFLDNLRFRRARDLLAAIGPLDQRDRLDFLVARAPNRFVPFLLRHRYLALVVAINLPGNFLIGGGGGICMIAGISRLFTVPGFITAIAVAVSPLPLAILLLGESVAGS